MHQVIFYPVGNGDTSQVILENGKRILMDFRHLQKAEEDDGLEIDLAARLREELQEAKKDSFDVVAFTHGDADHISGSTDFFELLHAEKYQGGDRIPIPELWVPAAMLLEEVDQESRSKEFAIWRAEARHRLRKGEGIRVFSKPEMLKDWLESQGLTVDDRRDLIIDAGKIVPTFDLETDGVEFFCHSPFIKHVDEGDDMRNACALIFNVRFKAGTETFDYLAVGDTEWGVLEDIVEATQAHGNDDRLRWDLFNIPHHCSYKALSDEKGDTETKPKDGVVTLLNSGCESAYIVCSSKPIDDDGAAHEQEQPPHVQAKRCYLTHLANVSGAEFLVTMEEPSRKAPEPIVFEIGSAGITRRRKAKIGAAAVISRPAPRAG